eukprot:836850-Rhodomonas_salina.1
MSQLNAIFPTGERACNMSGERIYARVPPLPCLRLISPPSHFFLVGAAGDAKIKQIRAKQQKTVLPLLHVPGQLPSVLALCRRMTSSPCSLTL